MGGYENTKSISQRVMLEIKRFYLASIIDFFLFFLFFNNNGGLAVSH
jgi:hypothetical protein